MPLVEVRCSSLSCPFHHCVAERFIWHAEDPNPECEHCGSPTTRLISRFAAPFTGTLDRYFDKTKSRLNCTSDGHIAYRVRSSRLADGSPEPVEITTVSQQRAFCKAEGLLEPGEVNPNMQSNSSGTNPTTRFAGSWV